MTALAILIAVFVLFLLFVSLVLLVIGPVMLMQPRRRLIDYYSRFTTLLHPAQLGVPFEELTVKTTEGLPLSCWFVKAAGTARGTVVYLHGVAESKIVGLPMARLLQSRGFNVFLYDSRYHGESGGRFCTYGFYEKHDASAVITTLLARRDVHIGRIGLFGASMGAAVALQVAALDRRVSCVVAESGFATLRSIFDDYQRRMIKIPFHYLRNLVIKRSEALAHFKANAVSPIDSVRDVHVPLFLIHGTADTTILHTYTVAVFERANDPKELWLIPGAKHHNVPELGGEEYEGRIVTFFEKHLAGPQEANRGSEDQSPSQ
jgi:fermentation-respiration switch protein FrsA (DUF1100 family)